MMAADFGQDVIFRIALAKRRSRLIMKGEGIDLEAVSDIRSRANECPVSDPSADAREAIAQTEKWIQHETLSAVVKHSLELLQRERERAEGFHGYFGNIGETLRKVAMLAMEEGAMREIWNQGGVELWNWIVMQLKSLGFSVHEEVQALQNTVPVDPASLKPGDRIVVEQRVYRVKRIKECFAKVVVWGDRASTEYGFEFKLRSEVQLVASESQIKSHQQAKECPDARSVQEER